VKNRFLVDIIAQRQNRPRAYFRFPALRQRLFSDRSGNCPFAPSNATIAVPVSKSPATGARCRHRPRHSLGPVEDQLVLSRRPWLDEQGRAGPVLAPAEKSSGARHGTVRRQGERSARPAPARLRFSAPAAPVEPDILHRSRRQPFTPFSVNTEGGASPAGKDRSSRTRRNWAAALVTAPGAWPSFQQDG